MHTCYYGGMNEEKLDKKLEDLTKTIMGGMEEMNRDLNSAIAKSKTEILDRVSIMISD